jgi:hypothetical protein
VEDLKDTFLQKKLIQIPELMVAHLCGYLGFLTIASLGIKQATALQAEITKLLEDQAKSAYEIFCKYPVNADLAETEKTKNLDQLRANSPGSLVVQTVRLGGMIWNSIRELSRNRNLYFGFTNEKQTELFCPQDTFIILLKKTSSKTIHELKNDVPIIYFLNQMTVQLGWLMGYYGHLDRKFPTMYLGYGRPCIKLYIEFGYKFLKVKGLRGKRAQSA